VTNYYEIDPKFGTMGDLQELIALCHERGVKLILDLVINHTARNNQWYQDFIFAHQIGNENHAYYDFYSWAETPKSGATYSPITGSGHYYECNFSGDMPELNFDNEAVRQAVLDVAKYYLDMGIDGFRFDAAKYIYYGNEPKNADFWTWYMNELRAIKPDIYTVAEVWDGDSVTFPYFASTNCFNFSMSQPSGRIAAAVKEENISAFANYVDSYIKSIQAQNPNASMVTFIANHDTDRAAGFLTTAGGYAKMAANLSILLPGSSFIYYGEEIGMLGSRGGANTDANRRLAMLWGDGDTVKNPIGANYKAQQSNGTVADQLADSDSLYTHYKKLIAIRKANPEIAYGTFTPLQSISKVGGFLCSYDGSTVAVLHNTTTESVQIDLSQMTDVELRSIAAYAGMGVATLDGTTLTLGAQTSVVLR
jgi:glycosidase